MVSSLVATRPGWRARLPTDRGDPLAGIRQSIKRANGHLSAPALAAGTLAHLALGRPREFLGSLYRVLPSRSQLSSEQQHHDIVFVSPSSVQPSPNIKLKSVSPAG